VSEAIKLPGLDLPDYLLADLIKLAPELRLRFPQLALNLPADPQGEQQRLFDSVVSLFTSLSSRSPVLICLEDIHWADGESLFLLRHLARRARIAHQPLLLLLTYHEADIDSNCCLGDVLLDLSRELLAERIKLSRYDRSQTEQVLEVMFQDKMDAAFVDAIYRETEGNLFYIEEICKALIEQGMLYSEECHWRVSSLADLQLPQSIRLTIQSRLNKLPAEVQDVLRLAAVIGREFDYQLLHAACDLNEDQLIDALETAVRTQLIYESKPKRLERQSAQGDSFNFAHRLIATALKESLSGLRRSRLHRRVATALLALYPDDLDALAYHYEQAKDTKNAVLYYIKAGDRARRIYANREAERYYRAALDLADDGHELGAITAGLGEALFSQSRFEEAIQSWQKAIQVYQDTSESDSDQAAHLYARSARAAWFLNDEARGLAICREGMASLTITAETPGIAALLHETARACYFNNLPDEALDLCEKALALAERLELIDVQADTLATLGILPNQTLQARIEFLGKAIKLAESAGLLSAASRAHLNLSSQLSEMGELHAARAHALKGYEHARKLGNSTFMLIYLTSVSFISVELAEFDLARQYLAEVRALRESIPGPSMQIDDIDHIERTILDMQGEWEQTAESAMAYLQNPPENTSPGDLARAKLLLANSLIERDQFGEALKVTDEILKVAPNDKNNTLLLVLFLNAASHTYLGNLEQASQAISKMEASRPAEPNFYYDIFTPLAKANLLAYQGEWEQADRLYQSQIEYTQQHKLRWHQARILLNWAQVDLLAKRGESAEQTRLHLEQARQIFTTIKASGYLQKIQKYLAEVAADPEQGDNVA
jgi:tetratricopeptide (TPR) repeat protein